MSARHRPLLVAIVALLAVTAGCFGGGGSTPTPTSEPTPVLTPPPTPTPESTPTPTPTPTPTATESYTPVGTNITIAVEATVEWRGTLAYENATADTSRTISGSGTGFVDVPDDIETVRVSARKTEASSTPLVLRIQAGRQRLRQVSTSRSYETVSVSLTFYSN